MKHTQTRWNKMKHNDNTMKHTQTQWNTIKHDEKHNAIHCNTLQLGPIIGWTTMKHFAVCCSVLQCVEIWGLPIHEVNPCFCVCVCMYMYVYVCVRLHVQHTTTHCNALQHTATWDLFIRKIPACVCVCVCARARARAQGLRTWVSMLLRIALN